MNNTKVTLIALFGLVTILLISLAPVSADAPASTDVQSYKMITYSAAGPNGSTAKVLAPQQDMSYPWNCSLYLVIADFGTTAVEVSENNITLATIAPQDMQFVTFQTPTAADHFSITLTYQGSKVLTISYVLTSVEFEMVSDYNMPAMDALKNNLDQWKGYYQQTFGNVDDNATISKDYLAELQSAQEPIIISAVMAMIGIAYAFAIKKASMIQAVPNGINVIMLTLGSLGIALIDNYLGLLHHNLIFLLPFLAAYLVTYKLYRLPGTKTSRLDIKEQRLTIGSRIFYEDKEDGLNCEALQDWRAVLARWIRGDRCIMTANGSLIPDWKLKDLEADEENPCLMVNFEIVEDIKTPKEERSIKERIVGVGGDLRKTLNLAKGGQFSHVDYMVNPDGWTQIMCENQKLFQGVHRLMSSLPQLSRSLAEEIIEYLQGYESEEPTRLFRTFIIRLIQRNPTALLTGNIWERYQIAKKDGTLGKLIGEVDKEVGEQEKPISKEKLRDPNLNHDHMNGPVDRAAALPTGGDASAGGNEG